MTLHLGGATEADRGSPGLQGFADPCLGVCNAACQPPLGCTLSSLVGLSMWPLEVEMRGQPCTVPGSRLRPQTALSTMARTGTGERSVGLRRWKSNDTTSLHPDAGRAPGVFVVQDSERGHLLELRLGSSFSRTQGLKEVGRLLTRVSGSGCQTVAHPSPNQANPELLA